MVFFSIGKRKIRVLFLLFLQIYIETSHEQKIYDVCMSVFGKRSSNKHSNLIEQSIALVEIGVKTNIDLVNRSIFV